MEKIIAIQADKINSINIKTDTTFQLALEAQNSTKYPTFSNISKGQSFRSRT